MRFVLLENPCTRLLHLLRGTYKELLPLHPNTFRLVGVSVRLLNDVMLLPRSTHSSSSVRKHLRTRRTILAKAQTKINGKDGKWQKKLRNELAVEADEKADSNL